jgi:serine/threonine-protein kinase
MSDESISTPSPETSTPDLGNDLTAQALVRAVSGQFRIDREIGRGGMGVVYCAHDQQLHRDVALKTLPPHLAADPNVRGRFLREARTAAGLSHPNIVPIFSAAEREGVVYFAMGFVEGESLAERIARIGPLSATDVVALLKQLTDALGYAHERGVVHRDVKAENVLLDRVTGKALVTDFGIARVAETQPLTATGTVLGTVHYMSPEQVSGDPLDGRSDLYSLGVLAFLALTGRFPFERPTASAVVVAQVHAVPPQVSDFVPGVPTALDALVARMLAKAPDDRFANAAELRAALNTLDLRAPAVLPAVPGASERLSSTEAQQVWSRAAELQANTGAMTPPPTFVPRTPQPLVTQGYDMALVRESAVDAGIDAKYVDRALVERSGMAVSPVQPGEHMQKVPNVFVGARTKLEYLAAFDGELSSDDFEEIADEVRRAMGEIVNVSAVGRTMTINTAIASGRQANTRALQLNLTSRNGKTQVRIYEDLSNAAVQWFVGLGVGGGSAALAVAGAVVGNATNSAPLVVATVGVSLMAILGACRFMYGRSVRKRDAQLQDILRRVVAKSQQLLGKR